MKSLRSAKLTETNVKLQSYYYNCSPEYIDSIRSNLVNDISEIINKLPKRKTQSEINRDLFWLFNWKRWCYDSKPAGIGERPPDDLGIQVDFDQVSKGNIRETCRTSTTLNAKWYADFALTYKKGIVQVEAQFGKIEAMFKDFCGFKIAYSERRLALGIEIVLCDPNRYFADRKKAISGMAYFRIAKDTLMSIGLDCPIWLIGIEG